jgi:hypothetical protein
MAVAATSRSPVRAGVHAERAADRPRYAVEEGEAAKTLLQREGGEALVGKRRAGADAAILGPLDLAKTLRGKADDDAAHPAVADEKIRADADDGYGDFRIQSLKEEREVVRVRRLEEKLGRPADAEPGEGGEGGVRGQPAANAGGVGRGDEVRHGGKL